MITAAEPSSFRSHALVISLALHACALALLALFLPVWHANVASYGIRDKAAVCVSPCGRVFAIQIEHQARAAATAGIRRIAAALLPTAKPKQISVAEQRPLRSHAAMRRSFAARTSAAQRRSDARAQLASTGDEGTNANVSLATPPSDVVAVASRLQPNAISANPADGVEVPPLQHRTTRAVLGPGNWGSGFDTPTLRDRALYEKVIAMLPKRASITITVDDQGRATNVQVDAPGLDAATLDDLRRLLLAAHYAPVERDGVAFDGTLRITAP